MNPIKLRFNISIGIILYALFFTKPSLGVFSTIPLQSGFAKIPFVFDTNIDSFKFTNDQSAKKEILAFCANLKEEYQRYNWKDDPCGKVDWQVDYRTRQGHPILYAKFGRGNSTLFLGGVHPDELTPVHISFRLARYLNARRDLFNGKDIQVIIAPLINPDGFFTKRKLRTNGLVDVNRNFLTYDWFKKSISTWANRKRGMHRYFPGYFPNTEIETIFQSELIEKYSPDKIFSIHAPLGFLDYDGPGDQKPKNLSRTERRAKYFVHSVAKKSKNYKVVDYSFYPGSIGNFAGNERSVPTITLELETIDTNKVEKYWKKFLPGFIQSIEYKFKNI